MKNRLHGSVETFRILPRLLFQAWNPQEQKMKSKPTEGAGHFSSQGKFMAKMHSKIK